MNHYKLTREDIRKIVPEIIDDARRFKWVEDFICDENFPTDGYIITGAKDKGGSFRSWIRLLYQLISNNKNGAIIRQQYINHVGSFRELHSRIIPIIERCSNKMISQILKLPSINTTNFSGQRITCTTNDKSIEFLSYDNANAISNMSGIHNVFGEELCKISSTGNYDELKQLAKDTFEKIIDNFNRFDDKKDKCNFFMSINPHDDESFIIDFIYKQCFDFSDKKILVELMDMYSIVKHENNFCGRSWTVRHCSVYTNPHRTKQKNAILKKYSEGNDRAMTAFLHWGIPYENASRGWLYKYDLGFIKPIDTKNCLFKNIRVGLDFGKLDKSVFVISCDNLYDYSQILILHVIEVKNNRWDETQKITYLLDNYLKFIFSITPNHINGYKMDLYYGADDFYIQTTINNIIKQQKIPLKVNFNPIPKAVKGMLLTERHLTLKEKLISGEIFYNEKGDVNGLFEEFRGTIYDGDKIIDRKGNDIKDAFFYGNARHFLFNKIAKLEYNDIKVSNKLHLKLYE